MIVYFLGILTGLVVAIIIFLAIQRVKTPLERALRNVENTIKEKGELYIEDEGVEDLKSWIDNLPKI